MAAKERLRLTDTLIARLRPREREYTVWDTRVAGLGVRVRPSGGTSFVLLRKTRDRTRRIALGATASTDIDAVRRRCHALLAQSESDHQARAPHTTPLLGAFVAGPWKDAHFPGYKPSTRKGVDQTLASQLLPAFGSTPLDRISRNAVLRWFDTYSARAPRRANMALGILRQILNFAIACGHLDTNPVKGIKANRRTARTRFLSKEEIRRLHRALDRQSRRGPGPKQQADMIRLLLLTGCRKSEIQELRWCEVQSDTLALADSKTGPRRVPLSDPARRIIERQTPGHSEFVFPSPLDATRPRVGDILLWYSVRREAQIEDAHLHDLRHTAASHAVMNGVPVPVVSRLLGHRHARMTLRYAHVADGDIEATAERIGEAIARVMALK